MDAARAMAAARRNLPPAPPDPDALDRPLTSSEMVDAVGDAMMASSACWVRKPGDPKRVAKLVLLSDDELGLFIDTVPITDETGKPLPRAIDECIRDTVDSMAIRGTYIAGGPVNEGWNFDEP
jgi:hypothetical protein